MPFFISTNRNLFLVINLAMSLWWYNITAILVKGVKFTIKKKRNERRKEKNGKIDHVIIIRGFSQIKKTY